MTTVAQEWSWRPQLPGRSCSRTPWSAGAAGEGVDGSGAKSVLVTRLGSGDEGLVGGGLLGLGLSALHDLRPELRALPVEMEAFLAVAALSRSKLFCRLEQSLFRRDSSVSSPDKRLLALLRKLVKLLRSSSISHRLPDRKILLHLRQLLTQTLG